jgi:hypothetical protein
MTGDDDDDDQGTHVVMIREQMMENGLASVTKRGAIC